MNAPDQVGNANAVECYDCGDIFRGASECPEEPTDHGWHPVFVTDAPLGYDDDQDFWHFGMRRYVYDAK